MPRSFGSGIRVQQPQFTPPVCWPGKSQPSLGTLDPDVEADERHHNPMGTLHGGIYCDLADAAMGFAYASTLDEGESFTTIELKINFLRAVRKGKLTAEARVVKAGSTLGYVECEVKDQAGKLVAKVASTCMKLRQDRKDG